jgi:hypothetical protein
MTVGVEVGDLTSGLHITLSPLLRDVVAFVSTRDGYKTNIWLLDLKTRQLRNLTGRLGARPAAFGLRGAAGRLGAPPCLERAGQ